MAAALSDLIAVLLIEDPYFFYSYIPNKDGGYGLIWLETL